MQAVLSDHHWFEQLADHLGSAYLRYSFTRGTTNEVDFLVDALDLQPGMRVLDVGCGPGRHAHELGRRGFTVVGVDISQRFIDLASEGAPPGVTFERGDARRLDYDGEFDAAISLCQGAFGLVAGPAAADEVSRRALDPDLTVLTGMAAALRPGRPLAVSAFSSYFQVRFLDDPSLFDADAGVNYERTEIKDEAGTSAPADLWTSCFTPRELRLLVAAAGLQLEHLWSVTPGSYRADPPSIDSPEFLVIARRR